MGFDPRRCAGFYNFIDGRASGAYRKKPVFTSFDGGCGVVPGFVDYSDDLFAARMLILLIDMQNSPGKLPRWRDRVYSGK